MPAYNQTSTKTQLAPSASAFSENYRRGALPVISRNANPGFVHHSLRQNSFPVGSEIARARVLVRRGAERAKDAFWTNHLMVTLPSGMPQNELESALSAWAKDIVGRISKLNGGRLIHCVVHRDEIRSERH